MTDVQRRIAALTPEQRELLEQRLADRVTARGLAPDDRIRPRDRSRPTPLAIQQEREWAIAQFRSANNIPGAFRVEGELDLALLSRVLTEVTQRHEVLRSTVEELPDGTRVQVVHPVTPVPIPVEDLSHVSAQEQIEEVRRCWKDEVSRPFDPHQRRRLRVSALRMAEHDHVVLITTDHAAADLVSVGILVKEFAALYGTHRAGAEGGLPPLEIQYADFAAWQRDNGKERMAAALEHWRTALDGVSGELILPSDRPLPAKPTFAGDVHRVTLPREFAAELRRFGDSERASLGVVLLAALSVLLHRYLERDDIIVGEIVSGRNRVEIEQLIGCFVSAIPLRVRVSEESTLREVVQQARRTKAAAYDHQDLPFDRLSAELDVGRDASQTSLSQMWIDVRTPESTLEVPGLRIAAEPVESGMVSAPLTLDANPGSDTLDLQWIYMSDMFDRDTVVLLAEQFDTVLRQLVTAPDTPVREVRFAVAAAAVAEASGPAQTGLVESFQRRAALTPSAPAVVCDGVALSFDELNRRANRLAHHLRARGVGRETCVGVLVDRSPSLAVAILGVLKAGGAFLPLDPAYPAERVAFMLTDAQARVLVTEPRFGPVYTGTETVLLDDVEGSEDDPAEVPDLDSLAYVIYTSGSTGRPKGAMIEHRSLATFAGEIVDRLGLDTGDRFLQFASPGFDVLVEELFPVWLAGGAVAMTQQHIISGQVALADLIERERLTVIELPTAYWHEWVRELDRTRAVLPTCLRMVIIGGERVLPERLVMWRRLGVPLMHVYGLTETTVSSTFFRVDPGDPVVDWANLPIGTPLPSADLRLLDRCLRPVPLGGTGELYIGGVSVARGYLGRPGLTAQRFIADPVLPGQRLYRTGDLVRRRPDGNLEFISRVDTQIKIRGFRVEPTEIESMLGRRPDIAESVVTLFEPVPGDRRLVAYVVPRAGAVASTAELRRFLEGELPAYMVPSAFVELDALPLSSNGKIDRKRLPAPDGVRRDVDEQYVAPRTPQEQTLAEVIASVVGVPRIGIHDNFFEVGGDSILAIKVVVRAQEAGMQLSPYDLFAHPTVNALAQVVVVGTVIDADQGDVTGPVPLAPMQRWFTTLGVEQPRHWNTSALLELPDPGQPDRLRAAVEELLVHHDGLRQRFLLAGGKTRVRIAPRGDVTPFEAHDLSGMDSTEQDRTMAEIVAALQSGLDPAVGPLIRVALLQLGGTRPDRLALVVHRLVADARSVPILLEDLATALAQQAAGDQISLPPKTTSWQSWVRRLVAYATTPDVQSQREYWTDLVTTPAGDLPVDLPTTPDANTVATERTVTVGLDAASTDELVHAVPEALNCRFEEALLAALGRTLSHGNGSGRHLVDLWRHDREQPFDDIDVTRTTGWFSWVHPVALACEPRGPVDADLRAVKEAMRTVPAGGLGWRLLRQDADPVPEAPVQLAFSYLGETGRPAEQLDGDRSPAERRPYAIEVEVALAGGELTVRWSYSTSLHEPGTIERLAARHLDELRAIAGLSRTRAGSLHTPSDFPLARVDQAQLDVLLGRRHN